MARQHQDPRLRHLPPDRQQGDARIDPEDLGKFEASYDGLGCAACRSGQAAEIMVRNIGALDTQRALKHFADWTDRIAAGELPTRSRSGRRASSATSS